MYVFVFMVVSRCFIVFSSYFLVFGVYPRLFLCVFCTSAISGRFWLFPCISSGDLWLFLGVLCLFPRRFPAISSYFLVFPRFLYIFCFFLATSRLF